jgi:hypothetical protein
MRPELARSGWFNTMMGKSLRKTGRDRHGKRARSLLTWERRRFGRGIGRFRNWFRD